MISSWVGVDPKSNDSCPYKRKGRGIFDKETEGIDHVKMEIDWMCLQAKECQGLPEATRL